MAKLDPDPELSHREIQDHILQRAPSTDRTRLVAAGNPDVIAEAFDAEQPEPRVRSGPAWVSGLRAWGGVQHHPGKMDGPDIGRKKVITY
jgi:hypothetical protein